MSLSLDEDYPDPSGKHAVRTRTVKNSEGWLWATAGGFSTCSPPETPTHRDQEAPRGKAVNLHFGPFDEAQLLLAPSPKKVLKELTARWIVATQVPKAVLICSGLD